MLFFRSTANAATTTTETTQCTGQQYITQGYEYERKYISELVAVITIRELLYCTSS